MSVRRKIRQPGASGQIKLAVSIPPAGVKLLLSRHNKTGLLGTLILTERGFRFKAPKQKKTPGEIPWSAMPSLEPWLRQTGDKM